MGDVHRTLVHRLNSAISEDGRCAGQMAFYRLRQAAGLRNRRARRHTKLAELGLGSPRATMQAFRRSGLRLPPLSGGWIGMLAVLGVIAAACGLIAALLHGDGAMALMSGGGLALALLAGFLVPASYPANVETLGDLAHHVARRNIMMLKAQGASLSAEGMWSTLCAIAEECSGVSYERIEMETPLIASTQDRKAA
jgi:hypothetical protein